MDRNLAIDLFLFGLFLTGFSILGHQLLETIRPAVLAGAAIGGIFLSVLAIFGARGYCTETWTLATLCLLAVPSQDRSPGVNVSR